MIQFDQISHRYASPEGEDVTALDGVSLTIDAGQFVTLRGPSGCGKSTLLMVAGGLLSPTSGSVSIHKTDPYKLNIDQRASFRADQVGFVFQQFHLVPYLDVVDNVLAPSLASGRPDQARAEALISEFGLKERQHHTPAALSTGERQRTALARALYNQPKVVLADEPTGNLDPENADIVLQHLVAFANEGGTVLMVSHDDHAASFGHEVIRMQAGKLER